MPLIITYKTQTVACVFTIVKGAKIAHKLPGCQWLQLVIQLDNQG